MIVFSSKSNFWYQFGIFLLKLHFTFAKWKNVTPSFLPKMYFQILWCQLKFSKQRSGFTFLRTLGFFFYIVPYTLCWLYSFLCWYFPTNEEKHTFIKIYLNIFQKSKFMTYEFHAQTFILFKFFFCAETYKQRTLCNVNYIIIIMYAYYMHSVVYFWGKEANVVHVVKLICH